MQDKRAADDFEHKGGNTVSKEQSEQDISNDIAIVSMVCRFPGVDSVEQYWELLASGTDALQLSPAPAGPGIEP